MINDRKEMCRALFEYLHCRIVLDDELEKLYETFVWDDLIDKIMENFGEEINEFAAVAIKKTVDIINNKRNIL